MSEPNFKMGMYRNRKILRAANGRPCAYCGINNGTTVAAHSNRMEDGKGVGLKAHDCFVAFLCANCHREYDSGIMAAGEFNRAMKRTWLMLLREGILR